MVMMSRLMSDTTPASKLFYASFFYADFFFPLSVNMLEEKNKAETNNQAVNTWERKKKNRE